MPTGALSSLPGFGFSYSLRKSLGNTTRTDGSKSHFHQQSVRPGKAFPGARAKPYRRRSLQESRGTAALSPKPRGANKGSPGPLRTLSAALPARGRAAAPPGPTAAPLPLNGAARGTPARTAASPPPARISGSGSRPLGAGRSPRTERGRPARRAAPTGPGPGGRGRRRAEAAPPHSRSRGPTARCCASRPAPGSCPGP